MKVSFDFDGTLDLPEIQEYAKELVEKDIEVWIVTNRVNDDFLTDAKWNNDLLLTADSIGIEREHIQFIDGVLKDNFFVNNPDFIWHLDDDLSEIMRMNRNPECKTQAITILDFNYKKICDKLLESK